MSDPELRLKEAEAALKAAQATAEETRQAFRIAQTAYFAADDRTRRIGGLKEDRLETAIDYAEAADKLASALDAYDQAALDAYAEWTKKPL
jgi:hypothetical protein